MYTVYRGTAILCSIIPGIIAAINSSGKGVPVIGRGAGGIPLQIINGSNGFLINNVNEAAEKVLYLLNHKEEAKQLGVNGREHVKNNCLIISDLKDYLKIFTEL